MDALSDHARRGPQRRKSRAFWRTRAREVQLVAYEADRATRRTRTLTVLYEDTRYERAGFTLSMHDSRDELDAPLHAQG